MPPQNNNLNRGPQARRVMAQMSPVPVVDIDATGQVVAVGLLRIVAKDEPTERTNAARPVPGYRYKWGGDEPAPQLSRRTG